MVRNIYKKVKKIFLILFSVVHLSSFGKNSRPVDLVNELTGVLNGYTTTHLNFCHSNKISLHLTIKHYF